MLSALAHRRRERALTLVEVIIGLVLLTIALGLVGTVVVQMGRGSGESFTDRKAQREALDALDQLRFDVRAARSPALDRWDARRETLRDIIRFGVDSAAPGSPDAAHAVCGSLPFASCVRDITHASSTQVWLRADVNTASGWDGVECVGWRRTTTGLVRTVSKDWRSCGPATATAATSTSTLVVAASTRLTAHPFSYALRYHPTMVRGQIANPAGCSTRTVPAAPPPVTAPPQAVPANQLNFINAVNVDLNGVAQELRGTSTTGLRTSVPVTSRTAGDYTYATGCSY